jgi:hypothetical protein
MSYCLNPHCQKPQNPNGTKFCQSCGTKLLLAERYRAIKPLAQGGFGRTLLAEDEYKPSKPYCVIKQLYPQGQNNAGKAAELFQQEAVRLEQLGKHPQIPELLAHFEQDNRHYIVQEFIDGQNLAEELAETGVFREKQIGSGDNAIKLWNVRTGRLLCNLIGHSDGVESVAFSPDGQTFASGCWDATVKLWDVPTRQQLHTFTAHSPRVQSVAFSPNGGNALMAKTQKARSHLLHLAPQTCDRLFPTELLLA